MSELNLGAFVGGTAGETIACRELLRYAVSRAMFCECGDVLDAGRAVAYFGGSRPTVCCCSCWDSNVERAAEKYGRTPAEVVDALRTDDPTDLIDARELAAIE